MTDLITCNCFAEGITIESDEELSLVFLSFWTLGNGHELGWKQRLDYCWRILWHAKPYEDQVVLSIGDARKLAARLTIAASESEPHPEMP